MWMSMLRQSDRSGRHRWDERFLYSSFTIKQTCYRATFLPSFFFSFIHSIHSFHSFHSFHSSAWLPHEYMDVLLLCWFQKERTYEQKGRTGGEVKSILYTQQRRRRHTKTTHVGQKKRRGTRARERERKNKKKRKKKRKRQGNCHFNQPYLSGFCSCVWESFESTKRKEKLLP